MAITEFQVEGYRSLKNICLRLKRVNVVVGSNGSGKSNPHKSDLLAVASRRAQLWITTHSFRLAELISERSMLEPIQIEKVDGALISKDKNSRPIEMRSA